jgi:hypothetical protein
MVVWEVNVWEAQKMGKEVGRMLIVVVGGLRLISKTAAKSLNRLLLQLQRRKAAVVASQRSTLSWHGGRRAT